MAVPGRRLGMAVSDWLSAPIEVQGQTIFAIGDVHGCADQLYALIRRLQVEAKRTRNSRLIFLGDLICRGPSSVDALSYWSAKDRDRSFKHVDRLLGNHEQLLMLSMGDGKLAKAAWAKWGKSGKTFVDELREVTGRRRAALSRELLQEAAGERVVDILFQRESHIWIGNTIFVHGGLDPTTHPKVCLSVPSTTFGGNHWAWIQEPFLKWRGGFGGLLVIHGHTPSSKHRLMSGYPDPHVFQHDRLCLDGGSASTGIVAAAQIEDGRYRVFTAKSSAS